MKFSSKILLLDRDQEALASLESDKKCVFIKPFEACEFAVGLVELNKFVLLGLGVEMEDLLVCDDATHKLSTLIILLWAPFYIGWLSFHNETIKRRVSLLVRNREHLVSRAGHEVSVTAPFSVCDLFAVLGDTRDLSLTLPIEESETSLFRSNG